MSDNDVKPNPWGREYSAAELDAARLLGFDSARIGRGPLYYGAGPHYPTLIRKRAAEDKRFADAADLVADALDREWAKADDE